MNGEREKGGCGVGCGEEKGKKVCNDRTRTADRRAGERAAAGSTDTG